MTNYAVNMGLSNGFVWKVRGKAVSAQWCEELTAILGVCRATGGPDADLRIEQGKFRAGQPFDPSTLLELSSHGVASPRRSYVRAWSDLVLLRHEELAYVIAGLGEVSDREGRIDQMRRAMLPFYEAVAARGGLPLHAALAEIGGQGVILAGVSGAGKSTCCRRFPAPWRILSDDLAVVVPCEDGTLRAHPLPTWSAVKAQTVERPCVLRQSVPVRAIFFLVHSDAESAVPVGAGRAALSIYDAAMQVFMSVDFASGIPGGSTYTRNYSRMQQKWLLPYLRLFSRSVSGAVFGNALKGPWIKWAGPSIRKGKTIFTNSLRGNGARPPCKDGMTGLGEENRNALFCRGESMRPLLRPGDRIRFVPCRVEEVRRGDVIIFIPPGQKERVVHRVVSAGPGGIRTKGDANPCRDTGNLRQEDIVGRAVSVEREAGRFPLRAASRGACSPH